MSRVILYLFIYKFNFVRLCHLSGAGFLVIYLTQTILNNFWLILLARIFDGVVFKQSFTIALIPRTQWDPYNLTVSRKARTQDISLTTKDQTVSISCRVNLLNSEIKMSIVNGIASDVLLNYYYTWWISTCKETRSDHIKSCYSIHYHFSLIDWDRVSHRGVSKQTAHWLRYRPVILSVPLRYLNQCLIIINCHLED